MVQDAIHTARRIAWWKLPECLYGPLRPAP